MRKWRRVLALLLAINVCLGSVCTTALATETNQGTSNLNGTTTTVDVTVNQDGSVTTIETTKDAEGNIISTRVTTTAANSSTEGNTTTNVSKKEWTETGPTQPDDTSAQPGGESDADKITSSATTTVIGKEETSSSITTDGNGNVIETAGSTSNSESTEFKKETTRTDVILGSTEEKSETSSSTDPMTTDKNGTWSEAGENDITWKDEITSDDPVIVVPPGKTEKDLDEDGFIAGDFTSTSGVGKVTVPDPIGGEEDGKESSITLKPDGTIYETTEEVTVAEVMAATGHEIPERLLKGEESYESDAGTDENNNPYVEITAAIKDEAGNVIGYRVTRTTTKVTETQTSWGGTVETRDNESIRTEYREPELPEDWDATDLAGYDAGYITDVTCRNDGDLVETTTKLEDPENNVTVEIVVKKVPIYDETDSTKIIGYDIIKTTTIHSTKTETSEAEGESITQDNGSTSTIDLPEKPKESATTHEDGSQTIVTVEEIRDADGTVLGYKTTTNILSADHRILSSRSESLYGTVTSVSSGTMTNPTTKEEVTKSTIVKTETTTIMGTKQTSIVEVEKEQVTQIETTEVTDTSSYQFVKVGDDLYFIYQGKMYPVAAVSDTDYTHGKKHDVTGHITVDFDKYKANEGGIRENPNDGGGYTGQQFEGENGDGCWNGYGLYSDLLLLESDGMTRHEVRQYAITVNGETRYVYCVEMGTTVNEGAYYEESLNQGEEYYNGATNNENLDQIRYVAMNGFWGTTSGMGSLEAVQDLMRKKGLTQYADQLTAGMAMAATQAAIWQFGTNGESQITQGDHLVGFDYNDNREVGENEDTNKIVAALRDLLVTLADEGARIEDENQKIDTIDVEDIQGATIILDSKVNREDYDAEEFGENVDSTDWGNEGSDSENRDVYNAKLSFQLAVLPSAINGDLIVQIKQGNKVITKRLAGDDSATGYGKIYPDENGNYVIEGLQLMEGIAITLNLKGVQHLSDGVYIYKNNNFQDFVGLSRLEQEVNLKVDMAFNVKEPDMQEVQMGTVHSEKTRYETQTDHYYGQYESTRENTQTTIRSEEKTTSEKTTTIYADVTVTQIKKVENKAESSFWNQYTPNDPEYPEYPEEPEKPEEPEEPEYPEEPELPEDDGDEEQEVPDEEVPMSDQPEDQVPPDEEIPREEPPEDEEIPKDDVPATGDDSGLWRMLSMLSAAGLALLGVTGTKRKQSENDR